MKRSQSAHEDASPPLVPLRGQWEQPAVSRDVSTTRDSLAGVHDPTLDAWIRAGLLHLSMPGTGRRRAYPPEELRAARALDSLRRLGGISPGGESRDRDGRRRALQHAVAECARTNPPGTVHDLPSPAPWLRVVLIVPE